MTPLNECARILPLWTLLAMAGFPTVPRAAQAAPKAEAGATSPPAGIVRDIDPAEMEMRATRLVTPEALKVLSHHFNATLFVHALDATILREFIESPPVPESLVPAPPVSPLTALTPLSRATEWTRAEVRLGLFGAKITRYWPGRSETLTADGHSLFVTDTRFPRQYLQQPLSKEERANGKWRERVIVRSGLDWGALGILGPDRAGFAAILLHRGLVSVTLAEPRELDGTLCDIVEIKLVNNLGGNTIDRLAIARTDGFVRLLEVMDEIPSKGTSVMREKYLKVRAYNPLESPQALNESARFRFVPPTGARRVAAFSAAL